MPHFGQYFTGLPRSTSGVGQSRCNIGHPVRCAVRRPGSGGASSSRSSHRSHRQLERLTATAADQHRLGRCGGLCPGSTQVSTLHRHEYAGCKRHQRCSDRCRVCLGDTRPNFNGLPGEKCSVASVTALPFWDEITLPGYLTTKGTSRPTQRRPGWRSILVGLRQVTLTLLPRLRTPIQSVA